MVTGVKTAEEMLLSSLGRILSAPGALSALSFRNIFVIISSVRLYAHQTSSLPGYGKVVLHNGTLDIFSSVKFNTNEKYSLKSSAISLSSMGALLILLLLLSLLLSGPGVNLDFVLDLR